MKINLNKIIVVIAACSVITFAFFSQSEADNSCNLLAFDATCAIGCPQGYATEDGCPKCECSDYPEELLGECKAVWPCNEKCENYIVDDGCATCQCDTGIESPTEAVLCDLVNFKESCSIGCPLGYISENGCPTCECGKYPADLLGTCDKVWPCAEKCEDYIVDDKDCVTCRCDDLKNVTNIFGDYGNCNLEDFNKNCEIGCPHGYKSENACQICECADYPEDLLGDCQEVWPCDTKCEDYQVEGNCVTCKCSTLLGN